MTVYRFDPPTRKSRGGNPLAGLLHFVQDPVGELLEVALTSRGAKDDVRNIQADGLPFVVDDEYDTLNFDLPPIPTNNPRIVPAYRAREETAAKTLPLLQQTYATGVLMPGIPPQYRAQAAEVAKIGAAKLARGPTPVQPPEVINTSIDVLQPRSDTGQNFMGGFIPPGGMAGFSQMTPASKIALTRGARRSGGGRKRRTKTAKVRKTRRTKTKRSKPARLKKGSAAAKRYMAKIRKKRR